MTPREASEPSVHLTARIPERLRNRLAAYAAENEISFNAALGTAVEGFFKDAEKDAELSPAGDLTPTVQISVTTFKLLYECAASYDTRIPEGNGSEWAAHLHDLARSFG